MNRSFRAFCPALSSCYPPCSTWVNFHLSATNFYFCEILTVVPQVVRRGIHMPVIWLCLNTAQPLSALCMLADKWLTVSDLALKNVIQLDVSHRMIALNRVLPLTSLEWSFHQPILSLFFSYSWVRAWNWGWTARTHAYCNQISWTSNRFRALSNKVSIPYLPSF